MKTLKIAFILIAFALALVFLPANEQNKIEIIDDYYECYEQDKETNLTH
ncbi:MAG: hypothetical protein HOD63_07400 [Bacteroidetes bacterium]|jgi:hypothetical protein|nr:hypothetical protein [Bacteroidota bacterium]MBT3422947.1 hypothetical protein [Bacteroidota bacterium]MBT3800721.1 hypothetical protein [Bacteroidota bacterium]MBT3935189.1 hypothetical protein [Bacteroidota bacterium]MBT4338398.1 hypothetical protein [Bacteroidota bacterium]